MVKIVNCDKIIRNELRGDSLVVLVSGGGSKESNVVVNQYFADLINNGAVLYIPNAGDESIRSYQDSYAYVKDMFNSIGIRKVDLCTNLNNISLEMLNQYEAIYISGGSISKLVGEIRSAGIVELIAWYEKEKVIYGQSGGGISLGKDVSYFEEARDTKPLGLIDCAITCHYKDEYYDHVLNGTRMNTYCIRDNEAVLFDGDNVEYINGEVLYIDRNNN
ncbi:Type 1 glutamine amidotransferase-like domain-containing protein [Macrococcoides goetzii]|uniref:Type 1 glutamine amidotransferase-like domain-containing protein n=1 Tax=Macrococcus TaxID=69965 RepID=UPI001EF3889B|nr:MULTISPECIES: Type 1 glutamine amidotransferase-like domain-containing protein [Macrococcus]MCG7418868.1 Type 1 glutamine amidotransferase-like domain-containing protein [Macrococcus epidermidis]MCH4984370.1 Type 1 glutamine amidotransferase-like domain-containing protein [Macrococcus sp. PK]MCH4985713.1 Type 1 glutamine amidotransferase-like domain-containing protein [Macrococcus sp. PK]